MQKIKGQKIAVILPKHLLETIALLEKELCCSRSDVIRRVLQEWTYPLYREIKEGKQLDLF